MSSSPINVTTVASFSLTVFSISTTISASIDFAEPVQFLTHLCFLGVTLLFLATEQILHLLDLLVAATTFPVFFPIRVAVPRNYLYKKLVIITSPGVIKCFDTAKYIEPEFNILCDIMTAIC